LDDLDQLLHDHALLTAEFERVGAYLKGPTAIPTAEAVRLLLSLREQIEAHFALEEARILDVLAARLPERASAIEALRREHTAMREALAPLRRAQEADPAPHRGDLSALFELSYGLHRTHVANEDALFAECARQLGLSPRRRPSLSDWLR